MSEETLENGSAGAEEQTGSHESVAQENHGSEEGQQSAEGQQQAAAQNPNGGFSQDQVDKIVKSRLARYSKQTQKQMYAMQQRLDTYESNAGTEPEPTREELGDDAYIEYQVKKGVNDGLSEYAKSQKKAASEQEQVNRLNKSWAQKVSEKLSVYPDFVNKMQNSGMHFDDPTVIQDIQESDYGVEIAVHLADNPVESEKVDGMNQRQRDRYFARLEARFERLAENSSSQQTTITGENPEQNQTSEAQQNAQQNQGRQVSKAPAPVQTPQGKSNVNNAESLDDFIKRRQDEDRKAGKL